MIRRAVPLVIAFALAACIDMKLRLDATLPASVLHAQRANLPGLVARELAAGRTREAFYVLEVHKTRGYAAPRLAARDPKRAPQLATAHRDLRPLFAKLFQPGGDETVAQRGLRLVGAAATPAISNVHAAADEAFWEHVRIVEARHAAAVPYAHILRNSFAPTSADEAALLFDRGELFVSFFIDGDRVHAFVLGETGTVVVVTLPTPASTLRATTTALRAELEQPPAAGRQRAWEKPAALLYDQLLAPIGQRVDLASIKTLYVSPDDFLANVPFGALVTGPHARPLIHRTRVTYLPSASIYRHLLQQEVLDQPPRFLSIGNPSFSVDVPALPFAGREAETLSHVFDESLHLSGADAAEGRIVRAVAKHNILHFATHGLMLGDQAPGASSLLVAADPQHDGFLSAAEISGLPLSHSYLVVLSACETAVTQQGATDLASLTGAFMAAGAPSVVGSLWKVDDSSTTRLMLDFYREFLAAGAGEALRRAQVALAGTPKYQHPYYWAPFLLYGWDK